MSEIRIHFPDNQPGNQYLIGSFLAIQFEHIESEIVARIAEHLIPFKHHAATAETLIQDFERDPFDGLLAVGGKVMIISSDAIE